MDDLGRRFLQTAPPDETAALDKLYLHFAAHPELEHWMQDWNEFDDEKKISILEQIKQKFGALFGSNLSDVNIQFANPGLLPGNVSADGKILKISRMENTYDHFEGSFYATILACARYQEKNIPIDTSMDDFDEYLSQPSLAHAKSIADELYQDVFENLSDNSQADLAHAELEMKSRFLSQKLSQASKWGRGATQRVIDFVKTMPDEDIALVSAGAKKKLALLVHNINKRDMEISPELNEVVRRVINNQPDVVTNEELLKRYKFTLALMKDSKVQAAQLNWPNTNKKDFFEHVAKMHAKIYGYKPCEVKTFAGYFNIFGGPSNSQYDYDDHMLHVKMNFFHDNYRSFKNALTETVHELKHAVDFSAVRKFLERQLDIHDEETPFSEALYSAAKGYIKGDLSLPHYRENLLEVRAYKAEAIAEDVCCDPLVHTAVIHRIETAIARLESQKPYTEPLYVPEHEPEF